jgi:6-phosphogluconolactonase
MLSAVAGERVIKIANEAIRARGVFRIALAGGSTPRSLYKILSSKKYINKTDWSSWVVYFSDERVVPLTDEQSNYAMAKNTLFDGTQLKEGNIYMVPVHLHDPAQIAVEYEAQIRRSFGEIDVHTPRLDLILLGLGSDGHTASLFPGKPALMATSRLVVESTPGVLPPPVDRITFTLTLINAARQVIFLASGKDKKEAFRAAYYGLADDADQSIPARLVRPENGDLEWFVTMDISDDI